MGFWRDLLLFSLYYPVLPEFLKRSVCNFYFKKLSFLLKNENHREKENQQSLSMYTAAAVGLSPIVYEMSCDPHTSAWSESVCPHLMRLTQEARPMGPCQGHHFSSFAHPRHCPPPARNTDLTAADRMAFCGKIHCPTPLFHRWGFWDPERSTDWTQVIQWRNECPLSPGLICFPEGSKKQRTCNDALWLLAAF